MSASNTDPFDETLDFAGPSETPPTPPIAPEPLRVIKDGSITYYPELIQGSEEWYALRCGILTASEMKLIITPTLKVASNEKERSHLYELLAQRITKYVEPTYVSDDMLRGKEDEILARQEYAKHYAPVTEMGFITNERWGFTLGYSTDGLVDPNGLIEAKSRRQKYQIQTLVEYVPDETIDVDYLIQTQTGLTVSERKWCDHISYSGGLHMATVRIWPDAKVMNAIIEAAGAFEQRLAAKLARYHEVLKSPARLIPTERRVVQEMYV
jgi:YqaJ-like viral recombinase domain